jgi:pimeloyl-ACP methyl ester carboxylesterase
LCATAARFSAGAGTGAIATGLNGLATLARRLPDDRRAALTQRALNPKYSPDDPGGRIGLAAANSHELAHLVEALAELTAYRAPWLGDIDVPTAVVLTSRDRVVDPERQRDLHRHIPGSSLHVVDGDHTVCATRPERFVPALVAAVTRVSRG